MQRNSQSGNETRWQHPVIVLVLMNYFPKRKSNIPTI